MCEGSTLQDPNHPPTLCAIGIGWSVLKGGGSTFLGVVALAGADSEIFRTFFKMLGLHRGPIIFSLCTLTIATALKLTTPAATKLAIDYAFTGTGLPSEWAAWIPASWDLANPRRLLVAIAIAMVVISFAAVAIGLSGRWLATKATQLLAVDIEPCERLGRTHQLAQGMGLRWPQAAPR